MIPQGIIYLGDGNTAESFVKIASIQGQEGPNLSRALHETTDQNNADGDNFRSYIAGQREGGDINLKLIWLPDNPTHRPDRGLLGLYNSGEPRNYIIKWQGDDSQRWLIKGIVRGFTPHAPLSEPLGANVHIKVIDLEMDYNP